MSSYCGVVLGLEVGRIQWVRANTSEFEFNANRRSLEIIMRPFAQPAQFQGATSPDQTFSHWRRKPGGKHLLHFTRAPRAEDLS